mmetsp:Transcript_12065/g.13882  ORF Transcript_12065/g.13882 Transcript_12065/m.13882 type:complete len:118 (+) Transcript_12065:643-996(+)
MIKTRLALGTGAVPADPIVERRIIRKYADAFNLSSIPEVTARNTIAVGKYIAPPSIFSVAPIEHTKFFTDLGTSPEDSTQSMVIGNVAADDAEAKANICAGTMYLMYRNGFCLTINK